MFEHCSYISKRKKSKGALKETRVQLAAQLAEPKSHLAGVGRDERWAAYLREQSIPLSTADRYVEPMRKAQAGPKLLREELATVTPDQIRQLAGKVAASVVRTLKLRADLEAFNMSFGYCLVRGRRLSRSRAAILHLITSDTCLRSLYSSNLFKVDRAIAVANSGWRKCCWQGWDECQIAHQLGY